MVIEVTVDNLVFLAALKHGSERHDCERQTTVAGPGGAWMEKDDHEFFRAT
jgi:hypothetical protein